MENYARLSFAERVKITVYKADGKSIGFIAEKLGRSKSTISRELARYPRSYEAAKAQEQSEKKAAGRRGPRRLETHPKLFDAVMAGLRKRWSPDQIAKTLRREFPKDPSMRISHESIYTYIYVLPRGELRAELVSLLRQKKKTRYARRGVKQKRGRIPEMISIEERPKEVADRCIAGDWEGDLIMGKNHKSALGTLVERKTRTVLMVPLKKKDARSVRKAFEKAVAKLPDQLKISLTYDQGHEMAEHKLFTANTKMKVYFCHPSSPWERGTNENTNGLIRDYFPKGTDFSTISRKEIRRVQDQLNERPRKTLDYRTPKEVLKEELLEAVALKT